MKTQEKLEIIKLALLAYKKGDYANFSLSDLSKCGIKDKSLRDGLRELCNLNLIENLSVNGYYPKYKINYDGECPSFIYDDISAGMKYFMIKVNRVLNNDYSYKTGKALAKLLHPNDSSSSIESAFMSKIKSHYHKDIFEILKNMTSIHLQLSNPNYDIIEDENGYKLYRCKNIVFKKCKECGCTDENLFYPSSRTICKVCHSKRAKERLQASIGKFLLKKARTGYRSRPNITEFTITEEIIEEVWKNQNYLDYYTGKPINDINEMSVDRIDSNKGYTKDNICITTININIAKNDLSKEDFVSLCKDVAKYFS